MAINSTPRHTVTITDALGVVTRKYFRWIDGANAYANRWRNLPGIQITVDKFATS